jgi:phosphoribosylaminoimidazolecarboxamide formyltransferase/IMP cyclohydrolase
MNRKKHNMADKKSFEGVHAADVKYGENPWQQSDGLYSDPNSEDPLAISQFVLQEGDAPSFNNYGDVDRLLQTMTHIAAGFDLNNGSVPDIALGAKHGNMCGGAADDDPRFLIQKMLDGDPRAIFGGAVMINFPLTHKIAEELIQYNVQAGQKRLLDVATAPEMSAFVPEMLARKGGKLRVLTNQALGSLSIDSLDKTERFKYVRGGFLAQQNYTYIPNFRSEGWQKENDTAYPYLERDLILAWGIGSTSTSNTITLVKEGMLIGNGVGQQDRVSAANLAITRAHDAGHSTEGAVAYSDSFFPFADGPEVLADAGIKAVFTSSGSVNDKSVFKAFERKNVKVFSAPDKEIRGFYGH